MAWSAEEKQRRAALDAQFEARKKAAVAANAAKVDAQLKAKKTATAKPAAKKVSSAEQAAKARRDAAIKKAAPSGFQRLLSTLGYKWD